MAGITIWAGHRNLTSIAHRGHRRGQREQRQYKRRNCASDVHRSNSTDSHSPMARSPTANHISHYVVLPLQPLCPHEQSMSGVFSIASHWVLQYLPDVITHVQTGCAHFWGFAVAISFLLASGHHRVIQDGILITGTKRFCPIRNTLHFGHRVATADVAGNTVVTGRARKPCVLQAEDANSREQQTLS
jgi:hypothetical protein